MLPARALLGRELALPRSFASGGDAGCPCPRSSRPRLRRAASTLARREPGAACLRGAAAGYAGSGAEAIDMDGLNYVVPAHEGSGEERAEERHGSTARTWRTSSDRAYRGVFGGRRGSAGRGRAPTRDPFAGEHGRAARRHPPPAMTGRNKRRVALPARRTQWYMAHPSSQSSWTRSGSASLQNFCVV